MDFYKQLQKSPTIPVPIEQRICFPYYSWTVGQVKVEPDRSPQKSDGKYQSTHLTSQKNEGLIIIINIISFMEGIYTYIPETNHVPRDYSVAAILLLLFMVLILLVPVLNLLYFYISTFRSMCAVPNRAVFCSSLISCFPGMLLTYFLNGFEMVPVAPVFTGITLVFTFHMSCISIVRSFYFRIFSTSF